jgi:hypothetical protein
LESLKAVWKKLVIILKVGNIKPLCVFKGVICCVSTGDSRELDTLAKIGKILGNKRLDLLFIDGNHSLNSVKHDFETYSMFVRDGGWVAFHDIVPDYRTRFGIADSIWTGDVPQYWRKVRRFWRSIEIVEAEDQDGYGIGLLEWAHEVESNSIE